eukprot:5140779-Prymnesium_polylepis.1
MTHRGACARRRLLARDDSPPAVQASPPVPMASAGATLAVRTPFLKHLDAQVEARLKLGAHPLERLDHRAVREHLGRRLVPLPLLPLALQLELVLVPRLRLRLALRHQPLKQQRDPRQQQLVALRQHAVLWRQVALARERRLVVSHRRLALSEDREEHGGQDEDGDKEVDEEQHGIEVVSRVVLDLLEGKVAEEGAQQRDDRGRDGVEVVHKRAELRVEEHREGEHRRREDDAKEDEVVASLGEHVGHERHLGHDDVGELDHLEQLNRDAGRQVELRHARRIEHLPRVEDAELGAEARRAAVASAVALGELHCPGDPDEGLREEEEVDPVQEVPQVAEVGDQAGAVYLDQFEHHKPQGDGGADGQEHALLVVVGLVVDQRLHVERREYRSEVGDLEHVLDEEADAAAIFGSYLDSDGEYAGLHVDPATLLERLQHVDHHGAHDGALRILALLAPLRKVDPIDARTSAVVPRLAPVVARRLVRPIVGHIGGGALLGRQ